MSNFDYLTGGVRVKFECPEALKDGLDKFYLRPNSQYYENMNSRVLYHESIHFWQLISSGYLGNLLASEWKRLLDFESKHVVNPISTEEIKFGQRGKEPFSAKELTECWARFWDVHSRNPETIIEEEDLEEEFLGATRPHPMSKGYSGESFDFVMTHGPKSSTYEAPYKWLLQQMRSDEIIPDQLVGNPEKLAGDSSFLSVLLFPAVCHAAFGCQHPVEFFIHCTSTTLTKHKMLASVLIFNKSRYGAINLDWLNSWGFIHREIINPTLRELNCPDYTSGLDVIERGILNNHPLYVIYLKRLKFINQMVGRQHLTFMMNQHNVKDYQYIYQKAIVSEPFKDPWIIFGQPGQPDFRYFLGICMHPPCVAFNDTSFYPSDPFAARDHDPIRAMEEQEVMKKLTNELVTRVERFRKAEFAFNNEMKIDTYL